MSTNFLLKLQNNTDFFEALFNFRTVLKVSKYRVSSGPYFPVFSPNTKKYGLEKIPYLDTFRVVLRGIFNFRKIIFQKNSKRLVC